MIIRKNLFYGVEVPTWFQLGMPPVHLLPKKEIQVTVKEETFSDDYSCKKSLKEILAFVGDHPADKVNIKSFGDQYTGELTIECFDIINNPKYTEQLLEFKKAFREWRSVRKLVEEAIEKGVDRYEGVEPEDRPLIGIMDFKIFKNIPAGLVPNTVEDYIALGSINP